MAPRITITADTTAFDADAQELLGRALPSEVKGAVNKAARATVTELKKKLVEVFDRPNAFTLNAFAVLPADSKAGSDTVSALIYVRPQQAEYLSLQIDGGVRAAGDYATTTTGPLVPGKGAKLDRYGNLPRGYLARVEATGDAWWGTTPTGLRGLWRRSKDGAVEAVAVIVPEVQLQPRFDFDGIIEAVAPRALESAVEDALRVIAARTDGSSTGVRS